MASAGLSWFLLHGYAMWAVWSLVGLYQIATNRYFKHRWQTNLWLHRAGGVLIAFTTIFYGINALIKLEWKVVQDWHAYLGIITLALVTFVAASGIVARSRLNRADEDQQKMLNFKYFHSFFAYSVIIIGEITVFWGIRMYHVNRDMDTDLPWIHLAIFFGIWLVMEIFHQNFIHKNPIKFDEPLSTMTVDEFNKISASESSRRLVILDDLVLDVTDFAKQHPGGRFLLEKNFGRDISKFFHGGYSLEPTKNSKTHTHSNTARLIVNSLILARLVQKAETSTVRVVSKQRADADSGINTLTLQSSLPDGKISDKIQEFYSDISMIGRHYLVREKQNGKIGFARHYTIANCMAPEMHNHYLRALKDASVLRTSSGVNMSNKLPIFTLDRYLYNVPSKSLYLTLKNYAWMAPKGVSSRLSNANESNSQFEVKGPMGTGLGLNEHSTGIHVAYAAGTGVLVFIDLVAYLIRHQINCLHGDEARLSENFVFIFNVAFSNKDSAIALKFLQLANELESKNFELRLVIRSGEDGHDNTKWDQKNVVGALQALPEVPEKVWVCGPPYLNEMFDKIAPALRTKIGTKVHIL